MIRSTASTATFGVGVAVLAAGLGWLTVRGDRETLAAVVVPALLLAWALWILLYRPAVRYDAVAATIVNIGRVHVLPWARVGEVEQRLNLVFRLDDGRKVDAWGAPYPAKPGLIARRLDRDSAARYDFRTHETALENVRVAAAPSEAPVVSRWDRAPLTAGAVLAAGLVVELVVAHAS
ncbi:hypothetical protein [Xylanimonas protaetiae]|uniref:PH domain-containing protein n=1 Tax=Xylanimonas protaetiae TaxID=2509457 RepID=A0A4P6F4E4_9MICO|nr:hypothetical protein [Xylanimonas protaetiae]QAY70434.1 hypothetical protein ET471_10645 [Xylanimonas protaetiae]